MKSDALKTVFIHIPKCGGTSLEDILFQHSERTPENFWMGAINRPQDRYYRLFFRIFLKNREPIINRYQTGGLQHLKALQVRHAMGRDTFDSFYRFAVVRHPVNRSLSQYRYMMRRPDLMNWIGMTVNSGFLEYLEKTYRRAHVQWEPQVNFINDHLGNRLVEDVVKLENLEADMKVVFKKMGLPQLKIPHLNATIKKNKKTTLTDEERGILWELYKEDFEEFGYDVNKF